MTKNNQKQKKINRLANVAIANALQLEVARRRACRSGLFLKFCTARAPKLLFHNF